MAAITYCLWILWKVCVTLHFLATNRKLTFSWKITPQGGVPPLNWTNVDFILVRFCGIHLKAISQWVSILLFCIIGFEVSLAALNIQCLAYDQNKSTCYQSFFFTKKQVHLLEYVIIGCYVMLEALCNNIHQSAEAGVQADAEDGMKVGALKHVSCLPHQLHHHDIILRHAACLGHGDSEEALVDQIELLTGQYYFITFLFSLDLFLR